MDSRESYEATHSKKGFFKLCLFHSRCRGGPSAICSFECGHESLIKWCPHIFVQASSLGSFREHSPHPTCSAWAVVFVEALTEYCVAGGVAPGWRAVLGLAAGCARTAVGLLAAPEGSGASCWRPDCSARSLPRCSARRPPRRLPAPPRRPDSLLPTSGPHRFRQPPSRSHRTGLHCRLLPATLCLLRQGTQSTSLPSVTSPCISKRTGVHQDK